MPVASYSSGPLMAFNQANKWANPLRQSIIFKLKDLRSLSVIACQNFKQKAKRNEMKLNELE